MEELKKGFNQGYQLYIKKPDLAESLAKGMQQPYNDYTIGFTSGVIQALKERGLENEQVLSIELT